MSTSHKNGRTASKVLKVALSAALAAAFTPMVAAPAFAAAPTTEQTAAVLDTAKGTLQSPRGMFIVDGRNVYVGYNYGSTSTGTAGQNDYDVFGAVTDDISSYLHGLHAQSSAEGAVSVTKIAYSNVSYLWVGDQDGHWTYTPSQGDSVLLESEISKALTTQLANNAANVSLRLYTSETDYADVTLMVRISKATLLKKDKTVVTTSLEEALRDAVAGETVTMASDAVYNKQLTLNAGVVLEGNYRTLIHPSNPANTAAGSAAAILHNPQTAAAEGSANTATIRNLKIEGPNTTPATVAEGVTTPHWNEGEYAIKSYGQYADLVVQNVEINRAQSALMATQGAKLTVKGSLKMTNVEYGGIEVSESANSELVLDSTASITYTETADTPFAWVDGSGKITNDTALGLAKVDKTPAVTESVPSPKYKAHYYLNSADAKGTHLYTAAPMAEPAENAQTTPTRVVLNGKSEYALLKFVPSTSATYCFASSGTADAAAELYTVTSTGALSSAKIASGDNEQGENFRVFAKLTQGTTYVLRVGISSAAKNVPASNAIDVTVSKAVATSLDSCVVSLPSNRYYYSNDEITVDKLKTYGITVRSAIDGKPVAAESYTPTIHAVGSNGAIASGTTGTITAAGTYVLKVSAVQDKGYTGEAFCYFTVLDSTNIADYDFKYTNTLVFNSNQVASISSLAPKGYRYGSSTATFTEANLKFVGWFKQNADGTCGDALANAPSAVGKYILQLSPINAAGKSDFNANSTIDLKFSITKGKVTPPAARTGLTYTGSAQQGVPAGASYTLSGTYSATNAGTYSCTATLADGYSWTDGTTAPKTITWSIAKAKVAVPAGAANLVYTGKAQTGVAAGTGYTLSGTTTATEPGTYTCTATPAANYAWTDGTSTSKTVTWTLGKAPAGITATPSSVVVDAGTKAVVSLKQAGTAAYTVASSNSSVATATVSGSVLTITAKASGSATVTVSTAATARYAAGTCAITVSVPKAEGATGSVTDTVTNADGTTTKVTNTFKVTKAADPDDADVTPTVAFTGTNASGKFTVPSSVTLADGITYKVTSIASRAFEGEAVTQVTVPKGVTKIGSYAFRNCKKLTKVTLPSTLKEVGTSAFYGCSKLTSVSVAGGKIGKNAFRNCSRLGSITLGSKVSSVGASALKGAKATSITIKSSKLSKTSIKNLVKDSKITTIKCPDLSKKVKANYSNWAKTYKWNVKLK